MKSNASITLLSLFAVFVLAASFDCGPDSAQFKMTVVTLPAVLLVLAVAARTLSLRLAQRRQPVRVLK